MESRNWLILTLISLLAIDGIILANVPVLNQVLTNLYLLLIPGLLVLIILKLDGISFIKKFLISLGISITSLIFLGLVINSFYPVISRPLSLIPLLTIFNIMIIGLISIAYKFNKAGFNLNRLFDINLDIKNKSIVTFIFPVIFPIFAILGTYLMNTWENNIILLVMLLLISIYIIFLFYMKEERIPTSTYPFAVWMISLGLLLMHGLTSYHIMGNDIHNEFYSFQVTLNNFHWAASQYYSSSNSVLSVTVLPMVFYTLSKVNAEYIFKLLYAIIGSIIPLCVYVISKKYLNHKYAFAAALFFIFQVAFIYNLLSSTKTLIAIFFFSLAVMLIFDDEIKEFPRKILFIFFVMALVLCHYTTSYVFVTLLLAVFVLSLLFKIDFLKRFNKAKINSSISSNFFTFGIAIMVIALIFAWYSQLTSSPGSNTVQFIESTINNVANIFVEDLKSPTQNAVLGVGVNKLPQQINVLVYDSIFAFIGIGLFSLLWKNAYKKLKIEPEFLLLMFTSVLLLLAFLVVPYLSRGYGGTRLFTQLAVFLAIPFVIGVVTLARVIKKPNLDLLFLSLMLISLLSCATYLPYHLLGEPVSPDYDKNGLIRGQTYIYDQDMNTAEWLKTYRDDLRIYTDRTGNYVLALAFKQDPYKVARNTFFYRNQSINQGYIFLRKTNMQGLIYTSGDQPENIKNYENLFADLDKTYDNGEGNIWFKS